MMASHQSDVITRVASRGCCCLKMASPFLNMELEDRKLTTLVAR